MIGNSLFLIISNLLYVCIVIWYTYGMLRAASIMSWNYGRSDVQEAQRIRILKAIVIIASVGIVAAITNTVFG
ncbi:MAG TPA: hypothetical protein VLG69_02410 [Candidatus Andersenbacteria bacterium]|nr:hypothetical protein [Candidatus Andersenbacteria bacterium]